MKFRETALPGAFVIEPETLEDKRGFFARVWCRKEFEEHGLVATIAQANTSFNARAGTLRGMHYQVAPHEETKVVRCTRGSLYDVIVDLRPDSVTYGNWTGIELTATNHTMLYVPAGFAHGFITLEDNTEVSYLISAAYAPQAARAVRWNDPAFNIEWPRPVEEISDRDAGWPDFADNTAKP
ncbi:MAG: dTDP-4-dehydrorhamnose 3,5-epimerase [Thiogranum sp.]